MKKVPEYCPKCKNKLLMAWEGGGFCDICVAEITLEEDKWDKGKADPLGDVLRAKEIAERNRGL